MGWPLPIAAWMKAVRALTGVFDGDGHDVLPGLVLAQPRAHADLACTANSERTVRLRKRKRVLSLKYSIPYNPGGTVLWLEERTSGFQRATRAGDAAAMAFNLWNEIWLLRAVERRCCKDARRRAPLDSQHNAPDSDP